MLRLWSVIWICNTVHVLYRKHNWPKGHRVQKVAVAEEVTVITCFRGV